MSESDFDPDDDQPLELEFTLPDPFPMPMTFLSVVMQSIGRIKPVRQTIEYTHAHVCCCKGAEKDIATAENIREQLAIQVKAIDLMVVEAKKRLKQGEAK